LDECRASVIIEIQNLIEGVRRIEALILLSLVHNSVFHSVVYLSSKLCVCINFSISDLAIFTGRLLVSLINLQTIENSDTTR
jgi:hypothetical protein